MAFENFAKVSRDAKMRDAAQRAGLNEHMLRQRIRNEADGQAGWAKYSGALRGDLNLFVDLNAAISSRFALTAPVGPVAEPDPVPVAAPVGDFGQKVLEAEVKKKAAKKKVAKKKVAKKKA